MKKNRAVSRASRRTRLGMIWEQLARSFWPLATLLALLFAGFAFGAVDALPAAVLGWLAGGMILLVLIAAIRGGMRYQRVIPAEVTARLDKTLPGRPLAALADRAAIGGEGALWQAHLEQMEERAAKARAVAPNADLPRRDPYALRLAGVMALVMALLFGSSAQLGNGVSAIAATISLPFSKGRQGPAAPVWEGWAEPPAYTRRPVIYLNSLAEGRVLELPKGSEVTFRLYGGEAKVTQNIGPFLNKDPLAPGFWAEETGYITVAERRFDVIVLPDSPPVIHAGQVAQRRADGRMIQPFEAEDDHGVKLIRAVIKLDESRVPRKFGLAVEPEPREPLTVDLALPSGDGKQFQGQLAEDLSQHPWANLPISLTFIALDGIEQSGSSKSLKTELRGKRFFDPMAAALIEIRRDLLWSRENAARSARILRALIWQPTGVAGLPLYHNLQGVVDMLESGSLDHETRDKLAAALWNAAVQLEDGGLFDALEKMMQAQQKLSEAIRNGASPDEVQQLMEELQRATDDYLQMLAEQGKDDPAERFTGGGERQQVTGDQIQQMMDEIQRLMNEGRMAEAQQLLEQFNRMMQNLQVQPGEGAGGPGNRQMNGLTDTLREQQRLSDEAFRNLQEEFGGETPKDPGDLAERQRQLREDLRQQRGFLPGQGTPEGNEASRQLGEAGRAMEDAEQALREGDLTGALRRQADAIQSMREGMRALGDGMQGDQAQGQQDSSESEGQSEPSGEGRRGLAGDSRDDEPVLDPLGRQPPGSGNRLNPGDGDMLAGEIDPADRARDLLDEIRRRSGEQTRPREERDYLQRLLDRF